MIQLAQNSITEQHDYACESMRDTDFEGRVMRRMQLDGNMQTRRPKPGKRYPLTPGCPLQVAPSTQLLCQTRAPSEGVVGHWIQFLNFGLQKNTVEHFKRTRQEIGRSRVAINRAECALRKRDAPGRRVVRRDLWTKLRVLRDPGPNLRMRP